MDWLSQVCHDNGLMRETFYYAVYIADRYLERVALTEVSELQLIGLTSLVLACKMEEVRPPSIYTMLTYCMNVYSDQELRVSEIRISKVGVVHNEAIGWVLRCVTLYTWIGILTSSWDHFIDGVAGLGEVFPAAQGRYYLRKPEPESFKL